MHAIPTQLLRATLALAPALAGCARHPDRSASPDTATAVSPSPGATSTTGSVTPMTKTLDSGKTTAPTVTDTSRLSDANLLAKEAGGDSAEVVVARLAEQRASDQAVKSYAAMLLADHAKGLGQVHALARALSITPQPPPEDTTDRETAHVLARLQGMPHGQTFDTAFVQHEIADHERDIQDAGAMASVAHDARVKSLIQQSVPELQKHLDRARQIAGSGR